MDVVGGSQSSPDWFGLAFLGQEDRAEARARAVCILKEWCGTRQRRTRVSCMNEWHTVGPMLALEARCCDVAM